MLLNRSDLWWAASSTRGSSACHVPCGRSFWSVSLRVTICMQCIMENVVCVCVSHFITRTSFWSLTLVFFTDITLVVLSVTVISELFVLFVFFFYVLDICQTLPVCVATEVIYVVLLCVNRPMFVYFCSILSMYLYMFCVV